MTYGIPYMGSKQGIVASIAMVLPKAENFYDLFGGGFSISHYMLKHKSHKYKNFHYNEIKSDIVELVKRAINGEFNYQVFKPKWVSKEEFHAKKEGDAYIRCLWSFGNNQKGYLFGPDIEPYKKSMHNAVVFDEFDALAKEVLRLEQWPSNCKTITHKRFYLRQLVEHYRKTKIPKVLYQFLNEKQLATLLGESRPRGSYELQQLKQLEQLQQLERLEQLQQLQQLEQLEKLAFSSLSYEKVEIKNNSIIYCDIPYEGTSDYGNSFNRKYFLDWAANNPNPVYISEYNISDDRFSCVYKIDKRSMLSKEKALVLKSEKIYWNQKAINKI